MLTVFFYTHLTMHITQTSPAGVCIVSKEPTELAGNKSCHYQKFSFAFVPNTETPIPLYDIEIQSLLLSDDKHRSYQ